MSKNKSKQNFPNNSKPTNPAKQSLKEIRETEPISSSEPKVTKEELDQYREKMFKEVDKEIQKFKDKTESDILAEKGKILEEVETKFSRENKLIQDDLKSKTQKYDEQVQSLSKQLTELTSEKANIEIRKQEIKIELRKELQVELDKLIEEINAKSKEIVDLKRKLTENEQFNREINSDKDYLESALEKCSSDRKNEFQIDQRLQLRNQDYEMLNLAYNELNDNFRRVNALVIRYGENPQALMSENSGYKKEIETLRDKVKQFPSNDELIFLRSKAEEFEVLEKKNVDLERRIIELTNEIADVELYKEEMDNQRRFIKIIELQKAELKSELDNILDLYSQKNEKVFSGLSVIDNEPINPVYSNSGKTLKEICTDFRRYLASRTNKTKLYYSEETIRTFIAGFSTSKISILEGLSGTGKSSLPRAFADFTGCTAITLPVQSSWKDRNDLLGFYNDFKKQYKETEFLKALYKASTDYGNIYVIILDEMNLSRIEYYFADLLSVLEKDDQNQWLLDLIPDNVPGEMPKNIKQGKMRVSPNIWFVGTANKDDSTFTITDKVYDRSVVIDFQKKETAFVPAPTSSIKISFYEFEELLRKGSVYSNNNIEIDVEDEVDFLDDAITDLFEITFGNRIKMQIDKFVPSYIACGGTYKEALDIIFSKKVLRKLHGRYDEATKNALQAFEEMLNERYKDQKEFSHSKKDVKKMLAEIG